MTLWLSCQGAGGEDGRISGEEGGGPHHDKRLMLLVALKAGQVRAVFGILAGLL